MLRYRAYRAYVVNRFNTAFAEDQSAFISKHEIMKTDIIRYRKLEISARRGRKQEKEKTGPSVEDLSSSQACD